ncbi:MAG: hypothetical protein WA057_02670 [Candidatus Magasanikiibacteriota bacterium]
MPSPQFEELTKPTKKLFYLLWTAFMIAPIIYFYVLYTVSSERTITNIPDTNLPITLAVLAIIFAIASFILPKTMLNQTTSKVKEKYIDAGSVIDSLSPEHGYDVEKIKSLDINELQKFKLLSAYLVPFLLSIAMCEAIVIFGLVLGFSGYDIKMFLYFAIPSVILLIIHRPNFEKIFDTKNI